MTEPTVDYRTIPPSIEPTATAWQAWWEDHDMWDGDMLYADLDTAKHHSAVAYVGEEYSWMPGDDPVDEAPSTVLAWEMKYGRWRLLDNGQDTGVRLGETRTYAVSAVPAPATDQGALRKPAYDAVFAYLRKQPVDFLPVTIVGRNAMIWHAVHAALDAVLPAPAEEHRLALSEALGLGAGAPWDAIHDRATELGLPPFHRDPVARRLGLVAEHRATVLEKAADWFESDGRYVQQMFGHQAAAALRRMAAEPAPADTGHDGGETEGQALPVCQGFVWIGQPFTTCDRCGQPAWEHAGEEVPVEGAGPFDNRRTVRPWKPGQADAIRAKWAPEQAAAAQQPKEA
jgi:hypothetical protein